MPRISPSLALAHVFLVMVIVCMSVVIVRTLAHPINPYNIDDCCIALGDDPAFCDWLIHAGPEELRKANYVLNGELFSSL